MGSDSMSTSSGQHSASRTYLSVVVQRADFFTWIEIYETDEYWHAMRVGPTIVVRDGVCSALRGGIHAVLDYVLVELFVTSFDESHESAVGQPPDTGADDWTNEVS